MRRKYIKISKILLKEILKETPNKLWDFWKEWSPKVYKQLKDIKNE